MSETKHDSDQEDIKPPTPEERALNMTRILNRDKSLTPRRSVLKRVPDEIVIEIRQAMTAPVGPAVMCEYKFCNSYTMKTWIPELRRFLYICVSCGTDNLEDCGQYFVVMANGIMAIEGTYLKQPSYVLDTFIMSVMQVEECRNEFHRLLHGFNCPNQLVATIIPELPKPPEFSRKPKDMHELLFGVEEPTPAPAPARLWNVDVTFYQDYSSELLLVSYLYSHRRVYEIMSIAIGSSILSFRFVDCETNTAFCEDTENRYGGTAKPTRPQIDFVKKHYNLYDKKNEQLNDSRDTSKDNRYNSNNRGIIDTGRKLVSNQLLFAPFSGLGARGSQFAYQSSKLYIYNCTTGETMIPSSNFKNLLMTQIQYVRMDDILISDTINRHGIIFAHASKPKNNKLLLTDEFTVSYNGLSRYYPRLLMAMFELIRVSVPNMSLKQMTFMRILKKNAEWAWGGIKTKG